MATRELRPHQQAAIDYALEHRGPPGLPCHGTLIADEPGAGKTYMAAATLAAARAYPALIVAPAKLRTNWAREVIAASPGARVAVVVPRSSPPVVLAALRALGATPMLGRPRPGHDVYIAGYPAVLPELAAWQTLELRGLVYDEGHITKSRNRVHVCPQCWAPMRRDVCTGPVRHVAGRNATVLSYAVTWTRALHRLARAIPHDGMILDLTATPNKNGPADFMTQLALLNRLPQLGGEQRLIDRYCSGDPTRAAALHELLTDTCMIRRRRADYIDADLTLEVQPRYLDLDDSDLVEYRRAEAEVCEYLAAQAAAAAKAAGRHPTPAFVRRYFQTVPGRTFVQIGTLRKLVARAKIPLACEEIDSHLAGTDRKLIVFAHHLDVIDAIAERFGVRPLDGRQQDPQSVVDEFQNDPGCRVAVLGLLGGVGHTLTAAQDMLFVEHAWTWGDYDQAFGRCFGRVNDPHGALATMLLAENTIDVPWWRMLDAKRQVFEAGVDGVAGESVEVDLLADLACN